MPGINEMDYSSPNLYEEDLTTPNTRKDWVNTAK